MRKVMIVLISSLAGLMGTPAIAAPATNNAAAQEAQASVKPNLDAKKAHRERRLQHALDSGVITQEEANGLRQRWADQEQRRQRFINSLTPEQKQLWDEMHRERRAIHQQQVERWKKLSPEQRQRLKSRREASAVQR